MSGLKGIGGAGRWLVGISGISEWGRLLASSLGNVVNK